MRPGPIVFRWAGLIRVEQAWAVPELVKGAAHARRCRTIELMSGSQEVIFPGGESQRAADGVC